MDPLVERPVLALETVPGLPGLPLPGTPNIGRHVEHEREVWPKPACGHLIDRRNGFRRNSAPGALVGRRGEVVAVRNDDSAGCQGRRRVDVVVEGRLGRDGTFRATTLLAKCASRYENAPEKYKETPGYRSAADGA